MNSLLRLLPVALFLFGMLLISIYIRKQAGLNKGTNFVKEYFIGGRSLGGFVLAMTTMATYSSVSSFVGGPGQAWNIGFGWVYMAMVQVVVIFAVLGIFGKKVAVLSRKLEAVTVVDIIRKRYQSDLLANISAIIIVIFFGVTMVAQFVGGAKLFEAVTGYSYLVGLILFGIIVILYTTVGGFKGVAITDTLCAIAMLIGMGILFFSVLKAGGGLENIMTVIKTNDPAALEPLSGGAMPYSTYFTQWLLVGVCTIALPQSVVRGMSYKNTKALHKAMIVGTIVIGIMTFGTHWIGVLSKGILTEDIGAYGGNIDSIIPLTIIKSMGPVLSGITIIGPIAATISTVSSLLISSSSSILKDVYLNIMGKQNRNVLHKNIRFYSMLVTVVVGLIVFLIAINPPSVIWKINMFAFGGLETAFIWVLVLGLFWQKANKTGALCSIIGGVFTYCVTMALGVKFMSMHQIVIGISVSFLLFVIGNHIGKPVDIEIQKIFFPEKF